MAFWNQYLPQLAATTTTTQATPTPTNATATQNSYFIDSGYMVATFVLSGIAGLLLVLVIVLICKFNKAKNVYV